MAASLCAAHGSLSLQHARPDAITVPHFSQTRRRLACSSTSPSSVIGANLLPPPSPPLAPSSCSYTLALRRPRLASPVGTLPATRKSLQLHPQQIRVFTRSQPLDRSFARRSTTAAVTPASLQLQPGAPRHPSQPIMAPSSTNKPSFVPLEIKPIDFSLTAGTDIPAPPPESPPATPGRPPTPGRGPLSSHPTSPHDTSSDDPMAQTKPSQSSSQSSTQSTGPANGETRGRTESVATANTKPGSPGSKNVLSPTPTTESISSSKRPSSVRRFFGFRSASSSDSLRHNNNNNNRPTSPQNSAPSGGPTNRPGLRERRKSGSWFNKRASTMFGSLAEVGEISNGSAIEEQKPEKKGPPPPKLPDLKKLGTDLNDGSLGADDMFKHIK